MKQMKYVTKEDVDKIVGNMKTKIDENNQRVDNLNKRVDDIEKKVNQNEVVSKEYLIKKFIRPINNAIFSATDNKN